MKSRIKITPKKKPELDIKARELSPEEIEFRKQADELRQKVSKRDPTLTTQTRLRPTAAQLKAMKRD